MADDTERTAVVADGGNVSVSGIELAVDVTIRNVAEDVTIGIVAVDVARGNVSVIVMDTSEVAVENAPVCVVAAAVRV